ncbi:hypothetical protein [Streptomyces hokutonensis]|uniref:Uncharacterized protein n=1 Tax=Streptomyces hokutonensis TaxID=1306990 RepID=A0ABW6LXY3_9ACTN
MDLLGHAQGVIGVGQLGERLGERLGEGGDDLVVTVLGHDEPAGVGAALPVVPGDARHEGL